MVSFRTPLQIYTNTSNNNNSISSALIGLFSFDVLSISLLGEAVIDKGPTDAIESDGKLTFSCTLNVTSGNDVLRLRALGTRFSVLLDQRRHSYHVFITSTNLCIDLGYA